MIQLLAICGSTRTGSYNRQLLAAATDAAEDAGARVVTVDLKALNLPFFDEDLEQAKGIVEPAMKLKELMKQSHGLLIASPEYNGAYSAVLKNAIDWASRQAEGERVLECFANKWTLLFSASPGSLGGIRGLTQLRTLLSGLGCIVLPRQLCVPKAHEAFDEQGRLKSEKRLATIREMVQEMVQLAKIHAETTK
jgi:NAD(P)H-dependent FMN reductase